MLTIRRKMKIIKIWVKSVLENILTYKYYYWELLILVQKNNRKLPPLVYPSILLFYLL